MRSKVWFAVAMGLVCGQVEGASFDLMQTIYNPTPAAGDWFGESVAVLNDNLMVVGAKKDDTAGVDAGAAYIIDTQTGTVIHTLISPEASDGDWFGEYVATIGDKVLVGAPMGHNGANGPGAVYMFDSTTGNHIRTFRSPNPQTGEEFGLRISSRGNKVLIGARLNSDRAQWDGVTYLFDADTGDYLQTFRSPIVPTGRYGSQFGFATTFVGDNILIGSRIDSGLLSPGYGVAHLFDGITGDLLHSFQSPTPATRDWFGTTVADFGDNLLIGAPGYTGDAYLFDGTTGQLIHSFINPNPDFGDGFGASITVVDGNILIGANKEDAGASDSGVAYLFDGTTFDLMHTFINPSPGIEDVFGNRNGTADIGGNFVISSLFDDTSAQDAGIVYIFEGIDTSPNAQPVPEPTTLVLLGTGLVGLIGYGHRRRSAA